MLTSLSEARKRLEQALALQRSCFLCGARATFGGVFEPVDVWNYGGVPPEPGLRRIFPFGCCSECAELGEPEVLRQVEQRLRGQAART